MFFAIAVVMGYMSATNAWVETQVSQSIGAGYANPTLSRLSSFGGLASWACMLPAAYFYSVSDYDKNLWDGLIFCVVSFLGGSVTAVFVSSRRLRYLLSPTVLIVNPTLAFLTYWISSN
jgi:hypothetical protein